VTYIGPTTEDSQEAMNERLVPGWLQRLAAIGWRVLATLALGYVLLQAAILLGTVTAAILVALIVAATFAPYVHRLRDRGWNRTKAAAAVSLLALTVITLALILLAWAFLPYIAELVEGLRAGNEAIQDWLAELGAPPVLSTLIGELVDSFRNALTGVVAEIAAPIASFITALILGGFLTFFLLQDGDRAWDWVVDPIEGWRADAITASGRVALERVGGYLRGTALLAAIYALTDLVILVVLGVPLAGPLAVLVFLGGFVPYLGGIVATIVILLVTLASVGPTAAAIVIVAIAIRNVVVGNTVRPAVYGRSLDVHPALVLVALPAGYALFGVVGLFAALPIIAFALAFAPAVVLALDRGPDAPAAPGALVPVWLDRLGQWSWRGLVVVGLLAIVVAFTLGVPLVVLPVILAIVLAATLDPAAAALRRRGWQRGRAALAVTLGTLLAIIAITVLTVLAMIGPLNEIVATGEDGASEGILGSLGVNDVVSALGSGLLENVAALIGNLTSLAVVLLLATLLTFYLLRDGEAGGRALLSRFGGRRRTELTDLGTRSAGVLGGYMIGTAVISLFGAATTAILMIILGLPLALPIAVLSFFLGFIPYIGSFIATGLAFLVTVSVGDTTDIVIMAIFTIVFNIAQGNFVAPLVYGRAVSLHPAVVLLAIPAGNAVAGIIGMFLVVPFLGIVAISWRTVLHLFDPVKPEDDLDHADADGEVAIVNPSVTDPGSPARQT
jgi:predicted PurR-regulated permease PerM